MQRLPIITKDGSHTISIPEMSVTYHSHHGAIQESIHVYINAGLLPLMGQQHESINVLELGFGTGLNALLTLLEADKNQQPVQYTTVELFPLQAEETISLNYCEQLQRPDLHSFFQQLHQSEWEKDITITPFFTLHKKKDSFLDFNSEKKFNLIYFDVFAPSAQPELWTEDLFKKLYPMLLPGGLLVTYCSKSVVRRAMQSAGFKVEKIQGARGKREMVRARKASGG